jgi:hypothetical protein
MQTKISSAVNLSVAFDPYSLVQEVLVSNENKEVFSSDCHEHLVGWDIVPARGCARLVTAESYTPCIAGQH